MALLIAGCGNGTEEKETPREKHDLRPHWEVGQVFEIREERRHREGRGSLPPAREIEGRSRVRRDITDIYREEVLMAEGSHLILTRRTYLKSDLSENGASVASPVAGKTYEIQEPFRDHLVEVVLEDGTREEASKQETKYLFNSTLRMAASMLPGEHVAEGDTWVPGRNKDAFRPIGSGQIRQNCSLKRIRTEGGLRIADIECLTEAVVRNEEEIGLHLNIREKMRTDLGGRMLLSHSSVAELYYPPPLNPRGRWSHTKSSLVITRR